VPAEIEYLIDSGRWAARRAAHEGPVDPETTMPALRLIHGPETEAKVAKAQRLIAQAPARVHDWLEATGAGKM
jgi:hypothetical protein